VLLQIEYQALDHETPVLPTGHAGTMRPAARQPLIESLPRAGTRIDKRWLAGGKRLYSKNGPMPVGPLKNLLQSLWLSALDSSARG